MEQSQLIYSKKQLGAAREENLHILTGLYFVLQFHFRRDGTPHLFSRRGWFFKKYSVMNLFGLNETARCVSGTALFGISKPEQFHSKSRFRKCPAERRCKKTGGLLSLLYHFIASPRHQANRRTKTTVRQPNS